MNKPGIMRLNSQRGLALIEAAIACCVMALLSASLIGLAPLFIETQSARARQALADTTQAAISMLERDLAGALPESVRMTETASGFIVELAPLRAVGRYRADSALASALPPCPADDPALETASEEANPLANDILSFNVHDTCLKTLGELDDGVNLAGFWLVAANSPGTDFYLSSAASGGSKSKIVSVETHAGESMVIIDATRFSSEPSSRQFSIAGEPRSWVCDLRLGTLSAHGGYAISVEQPLTFSNTPLLTFSGVSSCSFALEGALARFGIAMKRGSKLATGGGAVMLSRSPE